MYMYVMYVYIYMYIYIYYRYTTGYRGDTNRYRFGTALVFQFPVSGSFSSWVSWGLFWEPTPMQFRAQAAQIVHSPQLNRQVPFLNRLRPGLRFLALWPSLWFCCLIWAFSKRQQKQKKTADRMKVWSRQVLFTWRPRQRVFLDKVCIHQKDPVLKKEGNSEHGKLDNVQFLHQPQFWNVEKIQEMSFFPTIFFLPTFFSIDFSVLVASRKGWRASVPFFIIPRRCWSSGIPAMSGRHVSGGPQDM